jgi:hypothetical protein
MLSLVVESSFAATWVGSNPFFAFAYPVVGHVCQAPHCFSQHLPTADRKGRIRVTNARKNAALHNSAIYQQILITSYYDTMNRI